MSNDEPIYTYERYGFTFHVYRNRIDISQRQMLSTKKETLLLRQINSVDVQPFGGKLIITLSDNKKREFVLGLKADEARQAIVSILP